MSKISQNSIDKVKAAVDIVDVISSFVRLEKKGPGYVGVCPFHNDRHPSMRVTPSRQIYKCFVCGAGGDVFDFLIRHENMSFTEAVLWCARRAGIQVEETEVTKEELEVRKHRETLYITMDAATNFFQSQLPSAGAYLKERGYSLDNGILKTFRIGYAPQGNKAYSHLTSFGYMTQNLVEVNVVAKGDYDYYDVFRDRIVFPFLDMQGRPVAYSGRIVTPNKKVGKYVNTTDTPLFNKGKHLFGLYQAYRFISQVGYVYLV